MRYLELDRTIERDDRQQLDLLRGRIERYRRALRRSAQRARREKQKRLEAEVVGTEKERTLAAVCHDLRTPLTAIMSWAQLAAVSTSHDHDVREALSRIQTNAQAQSMLINDILDMAKSANGTLHLRLAPVDLAEVITSALEVVESTAAAKGIQLEFRPPLDPVVVLGDSVRLQRVVWNLLTNALKFTPQGGRVTVELTTSGSQALMRVADTGCGTAPELLPRIFERFEQGSGNRGGVGLGLPIVRRLVEKHGGTVLGESAGCDRGATLTVSLPLMR